MISKSGSLDCVLSEYLIFFGDKDWFFEVPVRKNLEAKRTKDDLQRKKLKDVSQMSSGTFDMQTAFVRKSGEL